MSSEPRQPLPACGRTRFRIEAVTSARLPFIARTSCVMCGRPLVVPFGGIFATFRIGCEFVGVSCDGCLDDGSRAWIRHCRSAGGHPDEEVLP